MTQGKPGRRMKIGANTLLGETTLDGRTPRFADIKELVLAAEVGRVRFLLAAGSPAGAHHRR